MERYRVPAVVVTVLVVLVTIYVVVTSTMPDVVWDDPSNGVAVVEEEHPFAGTSCPVWNLINGGYMASTADGELVLAVPIDGTEWNTKSIVRCSRTGGAKTSVYTAPDATVNVYHLNVLGDRVVFTQVIEGSSSVVSASLDGQESMTIDSCDDWSLCQVEDGWIYYRQQGMLCRSDADGNKRRALCDVGTNLWRVAGDKIYYFAEGGEADIHVMNLDGSNSSVAGHATTGYVIKNAYPIDENRLVLLERSTSNENTLVRLYDSTTGESSVVVAEMPNIERVCSYPDGVIATQKMDENTYRILSASYEGQAGHTHVLKNDESEVRFTSYVDGLVMYGKLTETGCRVRGLGMDGSDVIDFV